jgi:acetyltransferase-like isoleucine patch superfamily enzyme
MKCINSEYWNSEDLRQHGIKSVGENVLIHKSCIIVGLENIEIGKNVRIDGFTSLIAGSSGSIKLGSHIHIGAYCNFAAGAGIHIEDFAGTSQGVKLYTTSDDYTGQYMTNPMVSEKYTRVHRAPIILRRHVLIGSTSVVLPGVVIEEGSCVGTLSFVNKSLPGWGVYFGCPVKLLKPRKKNILELERQFLHEFGSNL